MSKFTYVSRDAAGQRITAVAEAESRQNLLAELKGRGLTVIEVKELSLNGVAAKKAGPRWLRLNGFTGAVGTAELAVFWREFATMVAAGLPVIDALESISHELDHTRMRKTLQGVVASLWEGFNLSQSLAKY